MSAADPVYRMHLRVMHACEKGATGVYWGHRLVASIAYRDIVPKLSEMHHHEMEHFAAFGGLMRSRGVRTVVAPVLWCAGGIAYGVLTALAGRRSVWRSTAAIEAIVERELTEAATFFKEKDAEVFSLIQKILAEEIQHKIAGEENSLGSKPIDRVIDPAANVGASVSKGLAERL
jgi:ubiquinone biosynthesis monooxygenase Coq7